MLQLALAAVLTAIPAASEPSSPAPTVSHGKLEWFEGSYEQLLAEVRELESALRRLDLRFEFLLLVGEAVFQLRDLRLRLLKLDVEVLELPDLMADG